MTCPWCADMPNRSSGSIRVKSCTAAWPRCSRRNAWPRFLRSSFDMETLRQILSPDFLLRNSVYTSVLVGFTCPLVGVYLVLRRLVFMGVALPQISSTGVAVALSLPMWLGVLPAEHGPHSEHLIAFAG